MHDNFSGTILFISNHVHQNICIPGKCYTSTTKEYIHVYTLMGNVPKNCDPAIYLVPEYLDFAVSSVYRFGRLAVQVLVGVHHHVQRIALHSLLGRKLGAQTIDPQHQLRDNT